MKHVSIFLLFLLVPFININSESYQNDVWKLLDKSQKSLLSNPELSADYTLQAFEILKHTTDSALIVSTLIMGGRAYMLQGNFDLSVNTYYEALSYCPLKDNRTRAQIKVNLGTLYGSLKDFSKAVELIDNAASTYKALNDSSGIAIGNFPCTGSRIIHAKRCPVFKVRQYNHILHCHSFQHPGKMPFPFSHCACCIVHVIDVPAANQHSEEIILLGNCCVSFTACKGFIKILHITSSSGFPLFISMNRTSHYKYFKVCSPSDIVFLYLCVQQRLIHHHCVVFSNQLLLQKRPLL